MVDLFEGVCANCERTVPVAACCNVHMIPVCAECMSNARATVINAVDYVIGEYKCPWQTIMQNKGAGIPFDPSPNIVALTKQDYPEAIPEPIFEHGFISDPPPMQMPDQELVGITVTRAELKREGSMADEPVAVIYMDIAHTFECPGHEGHEAHQSHMIIKGALLVGHEITNALIQSLEAVRDNNFDEKKEAWIEEGLGKILDESAITPANENLAKIRTAHQFKDGGTGWCVTCGQIELYYLHESIEE